MPYHDVIFAKYIYSLSHFLHKILGEWDHCQPLLHACCTSRRQRCYVYPHEAYLFWNLPLLTQALRFRYRQFTNQPLGTVSLQQMHHVQARMLLNGTDALFALDFCLL